MVALMAAYLFDRPEYWYNLQGEYDTARPGRSHLFQETDWRTSRYMS
jgi:hypothetical protein